MEDRAANRRRQLHIQNVRHGRPLLALALDDGVDDAAQSRHERIEICAVRSNASRAAASICGDVRQRLDRSGERRKMRAQPLATGRRNRAAIRPTAFLRGAMLLLRLVQICSSSLSDAVSMSMRSTSCSSRASSTLAKCRHDDTPNRTAVTIWRDNPSPRSNKSSNSPQFLAWIGHHGLRRSIDFGACPSGPAEGQKRQLHTRCTRTSGARCARSGARVHGCARCAGARDAPLRRCDERQSVQEEVDGFRLHLNQGFPGEG